MSIKAHIALGTLLGVLLGGGVVAALSYAATPTSAADASERDQPDPSEETLSPAASVSEEFRRPMRPGARRRLLQS